jgi:hypothetical protein
VFKALEHAFDISRNGNVNGVVLVIPVDGETTLAGAIPVLADGVEDTEGGH